IGGGVLGDCWRPEERGKAVALYSLAPLLGPVVGPVAGAWIAERSTWRWVIRYPYSSGRQVSWTRSSKFLVCSSCNLRRSPLLMERKAARMRKEMESDPEKATAREIRTRFDHSDRHWKQIFAKSLVRPFKLFWYEPIAQLLGAYMAFVYGLLY
ncbi:hypothetical protein PHLCEN_2v11701, partial [Hermanssonia centrifuga]